MEDQAQLSKHFSSHCLHQTLLTFHWSKQVTSSSPGSVESTAKLCGKVVDPDRVEELGPLCDLPHYHCEESVLNALGLEGK